MEVAGQCRVFIRDLHWKNRHVIETAAELICGDRLLVSAINSRVFVVAMQEEFGGSKIICCTQVAVACAPAMARRPLRFRLCENPLGGGIPFGVPAVVISGCNAI